jgi:aminoglycoside phosphotransferase (APT) family kinase protein
MGEHVSRCVEPSALSRLLVSRHPGVAVEEVDVLDDTSGSANRLRLAVRYTPGHDAGLPPTMFLKRNLERFSFPTSMYTTEVRIYREVLPGTGIEAPRVFAIDATGDDVEFTILMEDLSARPEVRVGHVLDPTSVDEVDTVLATLARLHGAHWGVPAIEAKAPWARLPTDDDAMAFWAEVGPRLTRRHLESGHRASLVDPERWPQAELWPAFDRLRAADGEGPETLLHGDVHAGNVYYVSGGDGGLLDWQLSLRGCWALDVSYLITSALTTEDRRLHERALLDGYLRRLAAAGGVAPSGDEAWRRYRQNALYGVLMWLITPDGVHTDHAQAEYLRRCLTAADDLETLAALS